MKVFTGFDAAWSSNNQGAIAALVVSREGRFRFVPPVPASFDEALGIIQRAAAGASLHVVAIDQSLIVKNAAGRRPVEQAVSHLLGRHKSAIQPSNTARDCFASDAGIWGFLKSLDATHEPQKIPGAQSGRYVFETYPAITMPWLLQTKKLPRYNPGRKTFSLDDWKQVCLALAGKFQALGMRDAATWLASVSREKPVTKSLQDAVDATLCALIAYTWWKHGIKSCAHLGDMTTGYMVFPAATDLKRELKNDLKTHGYEVALR